jgi:2-dehydro-3-deoxyphosphooctonate aldolase (KDO 8-P synthase)
MESEKSAVRSAEQLKRITAKAKIPFIFKSSYDKANRTSLGSFRGPGLKAGLKILKKIKDELGVPVVSDVHTTEDVEAAAEILDIIQIPALLSRQTDLILKAAKTKKVINVKKGQFLAPQDVKNIIQKVESTGNKKLLLTERGAMFGYNNLVSDFRSIVIMRRFGYPVAYDAGHSVQMPGGMGSKSGGAREFIPYLIMAGIAVGSDAIFVEVHENPDRALCDGPNMLSLATLKTVVEHMKVAEGIGRRMRCQ